MQLKKHNQTKLEANTIQRSQVRENKCEQVSPEFGFTFELVEIGAQCFITNHKAQ